MISPISDGQPITYDLLNQIISEVNRATSSIYTDEIKQIVQVFGNNIGRKEDDKVVIAVGSVRVDVKTNSATVDPIVFPNNVGFDIAPYVCVTLVDQRTNEKSGQGIQFANVSVTNLTKTGMTVKIDLLRSVERPTAISLHYIAIGPQSS
jgi:hypothetical protein